MRRLLSSLPFALLLAACSPSSPPPSNASAKNASASAASSTTDSPSAPANGTLGSAQWYAWVDKTLSIGDGSGHGPDQGSDEWNQAVQSKLGQEAPQSQPGSPEWQQSVDALLRTRVPATH